MECSRRNYGHVIGGCVLIYSCISLRVTGYMEKPPVQLIFKRCGHCGPIIVGTGHGTKWKDHISVRLMVICNNSGPATKQEWKFQNRKFPWISLGDLPLSFMILVNNLVLGPMCTAHFLHAPMARLYSLGFGFSILSVYCCCSYCVLYQIRPRFKFLTRKLRLEPWNYRVWGWFLGAFTITFLSLRMSKTFDFQGGFQRMWCGCFSLPPFCLSIFNWKTLGLGNFPFCW